MYLPKMKPTPFKLERYYSLYEFSSKYSICNSDCEALTIGELLAIEEGASDAFQNQWLGYTETPGHPKLRHEISQIYESIATDNILVCTYLFCLSNLESGDEVIVQTPCYESLQSIPISIGCTVKSWDVQYSEKGPSFSIDELKDIISEKTKVIFLNSPQNPTGFHFSKEEQAAIVALARDNDCIIFCDEVYRELELEESYRLPAFADVYEKGVSIGVMSKSYGLPGLRIGWVVSQHRKILDNIAIIKEYTTICNSAPSEFLAEVALRNRHLLLARNLAIVKENMLLYDDFFTRHKALFSWFPPKAGPISFVKMNIDTDDKSFAEKALKEKQLLVLPGWIYDYPGFFRVGLGRKQIPASLAVFEQFIEESILQV